MLPKTRAQIHGDDSEPLSQTDVDVDIEQQQQPQPEDVDTGVVVVKKKGDAVDEKGGSPMGAAETGHLRDSTDSSDHKANDKFEDDTRSSPTIQRSTLFSDERGNLKFVNLVVRRPCLIFFFILAMCILLSFLLAVLVFQEGNPFTSPSNQFDLKDIRSIQYDSLRLARDKVKEERDQLQVEDKAPTKTQSEPQDYTYWVFEAEQDKGVFGTAESIAAMREAFDLFLSDSQYEKYCRLLYPEMDASSNSTDATATPEQPSCELPLSPLNIYYASEWDTELVVSVIDELKVPGNIDLFNALALCYTQGRYCEDLADDAAIDEDNIRWVTQLNGNIGQITSAWDFKSDTVVQNFTQVTELASYLIQVDVYKGFVDFGFDKEFSTDNLVSMFSRGIVQWGGPLDLDNGKDDSAAVDEENKKKQDEESLKDYIVGDFLTKMDKQASDDTNGSINSYYFMGVLIVDVLLEIVRRDGLLAIFSLIFVFFWIRVNTGSFFLAGVGILEIFFSIPVAWFLFSVVFQIKYFAFLNALSIFIVAAIGADDIFIFMDAYKQSKYLNPEKLVDMETRMSWVYRRTGTAMAITSATSCFAFLGTLITPLAEIKSFGIFAAFVIFIDYFLVMTLFCTAVVIYHDRFEGKRVCCGCCGNCSKNDPTPTQIAKQALESNEAEEDQGSDRVSEFFRTTFSGVILMPLARAVIGVIAAVWISVAIWQTSKIQATKEAEQFLNEDHPFQKSITILNKEFPTASEDIGLKVYFAWGLGEVNRDGVQLLFDPENYGTPTFSELFDFNEQCQTDLVKVCDKLKTDQRYRDLIKRKDGIGSTFCFMEELAAYSVKGNLDDCDYVTRGGWKDESWQIPPEDLTSVMEGFLKTSSCADRIETTGSYYSNEIGWDGKSLRYAAIAAESANIDPFSDQPEAFTRAQYDQFVALAEELDAFVSQGCMVDAFMTDLDEKFVFMNNQAIYVQTAVQSAILGVAIAFTILLISTRVLHIAFFASLTISAVLVSVTGMMVMLGWQLGSIESILIGIIAGFSVDYVVHLAHAYETASGDTSERVTAAFTDMGISVLNGMITSVVASIPLFFCQLQFFAKFGTFLCMTIVFSWVFANFGFMSVLAQLKIPIKKKNGWLCQP